jgi:hypothetical protein
MKKLIPLTALIVFSTMVLNSETMAQCCMRGGGPKTDGSKLPCTQGATVKPETLQKFNKETRKLQERRIDKQAALKKEFLKDDPDPEAIATLRKSIVDIEMDMWKVAKKLGMKNCFGSCGMHRGICCGGGCGGGMKMHGCGRK